MLNIAEIFRSIDGEVNCWGQGVLTTFIRLQGCNLFPPCPYCDTKHAQDPDKVIHKLSVEDILKIIPEGKVTITGGEPLLQKETERLITHLLVNYQNVSVETNGSILISRQIHSERLSWIIDYKLHIPSKMCIDNFWKATSQDWIKFVIAKPEDFQCAVDIAQSLISGGCKARIAFSPVMKKDITKWGIANPAQWLAEKIIEKQLWHITFNLQIHKLIWPDKTEGISLL